MKYHIDKEHMELLYHIARETNFMYLKERLGDKFDEDTIRSLDYFLATIYKKYEKDFR